MDCERREAGEDPIALARELRSLVPAGELVSDAVAEIIAQVRSKGDEAIDELTRRLDTTGAEPLPLAVAETELDRSFYLLDDPVRDGLKLAVENVRRVAEASLHDDRTVTFDHHEVVLRSTPVLSAGVYVPGGRAPYPSTVVMGVVTARAAGVQRIAVCSPPGSDGDIDAAILAACRLTGADEVYRVGGAQAIAALAYGTATVPAVDVIVGPGNLYVQEAKRQVSEQVGIDGFAGPSDLVVLAAGDADPELIALDLLAQAEHGAGTLVVGISDSEALLDAVEGRLAEGDQTGAVARLVRVADARAGLELAQALAPEHLQLVGAEAEALAAQATRAGCVFVGPAAGTAFGDYIAGSNHVLPTGGAARFASALGTWHFRRRFAEVRIDDASPLARAAAPLARAEGFELHARSMQARIRDNGGDGANR